MKKRLFNLLIICFLQFLLLFIIVFIIYYKSNGKSYECPVLLGILNTIFPSIVSFIVVYISFYIYYKNGLKSFLYICYGLTAYGVGSLLSGWFIGFTTNINLPIHNTGSFIGSVFIFIGALYSIKRFRKDKNKIIKILKIIIPELLIIIFFVLLIQFSITRTFPFGHIEPILKSLIQNIVLLLSVLFLLTTSIIYLIIFIRLSIKITLWYSIGLFFISIGLVIVLIQKNSGDIISWSGRISQYIGCIYLLVAVVSFIKDSSKKVTSIDKDINSFYKKININFDHLFEAIEEAIIIIDSDFRIFMWNNAAENVLGYTKGEAIGYSIFDILKCEKNFANSFKNWLKSVYVNFSVFEKDNVFEIYIQKRDNEFFYGEITLSMPVNTKNNYMTLIIRDITKRKIAESELLKNKEDLEIIVCERTKELTQAKSNLEDLVLTKELLIKEIHHRVKNNLNIIASLISLQRKKIKNEDFISVLDNIRTKIISISEIHEKLYKSKDLIHINLSDYIKSIIPGLKSISEYSDNINLIFEIDDIENEIETLIPIGLIVTELVTNAIKYGFSKGQKGFIKINCQKINNKIVLIVENDGEKFPEEVDFKNCNSLGLTMVCGLVSQLNGIISLDKSKSSKFTIEF